MKLKKQSKLFTILESVDIYGMPFLIRYKNRSKYSSTLGIILSLISIIIIFSLFFYNFFELINHSTFTILNYAEKVKEHSINLTNIPVMFGLVDINIKPLEIKPEFFNINVWSKNLIPINETHINIILNRIELEYCNESIYQYDYPEMKNYDLSKYLCIKPNQNLRIKGRYGDSINGFNSIEVYFNLCINEECLNKTNNLKDLKNILYGSYLSIHYLYKFIDHYNYKEPLIQNFRSEHFEITPFALKKFLYYFSSLTYISNDGILFNKQKNYTSFMFDHLHLDFVGRNNSDSLITDNNKLYSKLMEIVFSCTDYPINYSRTYMKLTDIFSKIGGFIDFIFMVFNTITTYFSRKNLVVDISNNLVCSKCIKAFTKGYYYDNINNISKFINMKKLNKNYDFGNNDISNSEIRKIPLSLNSFKSYNLNDKKKIYKDKYLISNYLHLNNNYLQNSKFKCYLKRNNYILYSQTLKVSYFDYFIPYCCLKKYKKYDLLCAYTNMMNSYLSLEEILPSIERISRLYREDKNNDAILKTKYNNIFSYQEN